MMIIFKIARNELRNLFYSPVAWFLAIVFFIQCAYFYMAALYPMTLQQDSMIRNMPLFKKWATTLTGGIFFNPDGIINNVSQNLYLFIPLLTMGLMSREVNNGTIKLLYSSPIKVRQIVFGKYLAIMGYNLILLSILGFFMLSGAFQIKSLDYGWLLSAMLGFYLLVCTYSAIGLFMSSLTTYQIVSGIGTFTILFILSRIGTLWQRYDFIRDLTYFLSIAGRTEKMIIGLITTRDVIYFLIVIFMFLSFTLFKLKGEKESRPWTIKALRYVGVIVVSVLLGYITSRPGWVGYLDATAEKVNTIAPETQQILKSMGNEPLEITLYTNLFGAGLGNGLPESRNASYLSLFWDKYQRFKPDIKFKYVYYYDNDGRLDDSLLYKSYPKKTEKQITGIIAGPMELDSSMFIEPREVRKLIDPYPENLRVFMTAKYKKDTINLRTYNDVEFWPNQQEMASKLKRLVGQKWPKIYYLTGNLERNIHKTGEREYSRHSIEKNDRGSLVNLGFDVDTISLEKQEIPADIAALVLADPKTKLGSTTRNKLEQYIAKGGNLLILGEPGKQDILNPVLQQLGVQLMKGQLVEISKNETPDKIVPYMTDSAFKINPHGEIGLRLKKENKMPDTSWFFQSLMAGATAISYPANGPFTVTPLLKTFRKEVWLKKGRLVTDSVPPKFNPQEGDTWTASSGLPSSGTFTVSTSFSLTIDPPVVTAPASPISNPGKEDTKASSFVTAVSLTRQINNRQQRIIVLGDADYLSNVRLVWSKFVNNFYNWFDYDRYPVFIPGPEYKDTLLTITSPTAKILKTIYVWVLPGLLLLAGIILLIRRKRK